MPAEAIRARARLANLLEDHGQHDLAEQVRAVPELEVNTLILGLWQKPEDEKAEYMVEDLEERPGFLSGDEVEGLKRRFRSEALRDHPIFQLGIQAYEALYESASD